MIFLLSPHSVTSEDVSAVAPADYGKIADLSVKFGADDVEKDVTVTIVDDNAEEGPEKFKLVLTTKDPRASVKNEVAVINIEDDDGKINVFGNNLERVERRRELYDFKLQKLKQ